MGHEIERKFLVKDNSWRSGPGTLVRQGYLSSQGQGVIRVRTKGERGYLTVKGKTKGVRRLEFEYEIPLEDANQMLDQLCLKPLIEKIRYEVMFGGFRWEVDEFLGDNSGLVVAEIELEDEKQEFPKPAWLGREVSSNSRYRNASLVKFPYSKWDEAV